MPEKTLNLINRTALLFFVVILVDTFILDGYIKNYLPSSVSQIAWYYLIFGLPHIIASYVSYFSKEYFSYYKPLITRGTLINLLLISCVYFFGITAPFVILYTLYHLAWQQIGICRKYIKNKILFNFWSLSGVISVMAFGLSIGGEKQVFLPYHFFYILQIIGLISIAIFICVGIFLFSNEEYLVTTTLIIFLSATAIVMGYYIIGIIMMRFTHDFTAFSIYIMHDKSNKNYNYIYNFFSINVNYIFLFLPIFSVSIAFLLNSNDNYLLSTIVLLMTLNHYYLEGVVWKRGTLHRGTLDFQYKR